MEALLERIIDGECVPFADMERESLKHVFMEVMEMMRVEEMDTQEGLVRFNRLVLALGQGMHAIITVHSMT